MLTAGDDEFIAFKENKFLYELVLFRQINFDPKMFNPNISNGLTKAFSLQFSERGKKIFEEMYESY